MLKKKVYDSGKTFWVLFFNYFAISIFNYLIQVVITFLGLADIQ